MIDPSRKTLVSRSSRPLRVGERIGGWTVLAYVRHDRWYGVVARVRCRCGRIAERLVTRLRSDARKGTAKRCKGCRWGSYPGKQGIRTTPDQRTRLVAMNAAGENVKDIARAMGVDRSTVTWWLDKKRPVSPAQRSAP